MRVHPPDDAVIEDGSIGAVEQVGVLRSSGGDAREIVREALLQERVGVRADESNSAEVADINDNGGTSTREVFGDRSLGVRERHLPPAEFHKLCAERDVFVV